MTLRFEVTNTNTEYFFYNVQLQGPDEGSYGTVIFSICNESVHSDGCVAAPFPRQRSPIGSTGTVFFIYRYLNSILSVFCDHGFERSG